MNLSHAKAQRREGTKEKKGISGISYSDSATPILPCPQCPMPHAQCQA
ncbi:hypothetical protein [Nostoc sp. CMAA1605]|nr:hypothetical protein [Nostoc sp. CMAA1605]